MQIQKLFYLNYDLDSTSYKYGRLGDAMGHAIQGKAGISAAASTTVTTSTYTRTDWLAPAAFADVQVGDWLFVVTDSVGSVTKRQVATKTSINEITVTGAGVTWTNITAWSFLPFVIGTAATNGFHGCSKDAEKGIQIDIATLAAAGGVDVSIEGQCYGATAPTVLLAKNYAAATSECIPILENVAAIRVGLKGGSGFASVDDISVAYVGTPRR